MNIAFLMKGNRIAYKRKELIYYIYKQEKKEGKKRVQTGTKKGLFCSPSIPGKVSIIIEI